MHTHHCRFYNGDGSPALLQLATPSVVVLAPLAHLATPYPPTLMRLIFESSSNRPVFLCGVGCLEDSKKLTKKLLGGGSNSGNQSPQAKSFDASIAALRTGLFSSDEVPNKQLGLAALVKLLGGPQLSKPKKVQMSDWSSRNLTENQVWGGSGRGDVPYRHIW